MVCPPGFVPTCPSTRRLAFAGAARRIATAACRQRPLSSVFPLGAPARRISPTASASSGRPPPPPPAWTPSPDLDVAPTLDAVAWSDAGLVPAIAQQYDTREVLMMAWMSRESLAITLRTGVAVYYSRSRGALWRKGESSDQTQAVVGLTVDCDGDTVLVEVDQVGVACHTGRRSCFYTRVGEGGGLEEAMAVEVDPSELYGGRGKGAAGTSG